MDDAFEVVRSKAHTKCIEWSETVEGCWECTSHKPTKTGYPVIRRPGKGRCHTIARWLYEQCFGYITDGLVVRHKCDNRLCINPEHLELGTQKENMRDKIRAGTWGPKLSVSDVEYIRNKYCTGIKCHPGNGKGLAKQFGVNITHIRNIVAGRCWV